MKTEIDLFTTEAEYISLIQSMRYLIPLKYVILELSSVFRMKCDSFNSYTTTFEDNKGATELAEEPKYKPRTKIFPSNGIILESISNEAHQR